MSSQKLFPYTYHGEPIPPGTSILETTKYHGVSLNELANLTGVSVKQIERIIEGKLPVTAEFALVLERTLGMSADLLIRFEQDYQREKLLVKKSQCKIHQ